MKANILLHQSAHYRIDLYSKGFQSHGYTVIQDKNARPQPEDVLLVWNRNPANERMVKLYESVGALVLVTENGYLGKTKALAKWHHSGAGEWHVGEEDRFSRLGIEVKPWRTDGEHVLVLPQRSIGEIGVAMPRNWEAQLLPRLKKLTNRPIRIRKHPGKKDCVPIEEDLKNAWCAVVWASGAGLKAICQGIPVFHDYGKWIGAGGASCNFNIESPYLGDRSAMLHRVAWSQWDWEEISSGEAFKYLLQKEGKQ